ncbi:hypothetical protein J2X02_000052 [Pseudoxanthomonas japonensis]|jgi:hypothetical protein|uniref:hypothetical protein n=1 Tax=Pseudoxanthomonas TaxID=83618 RepID=UPI0007843E3A|nr:MULTISPECIES: hypothetical protein [Pseudoxanthomonas]MBA3930505.1 hypothetical protein [Xanthomonas sp.]MBL8255528.1 hypothetical protein [Pseudoxanthomonas mexicana]MDR7067235.1 hypothetical protein [Pseudoxanthomonas japonensis]
MWARATAGIVPGFFLSAVLVGLVSWVLPGPWQSTLVAGGLVFFPVWVGLFCLAFQFRSGARAWWIYGAISVAGLGMLTLLRYLQWVQ